MIAGRLAALLVAALVSACSSITGDTTQSVSVQTRDAAGQNVDGAKCELANSHGTWFATTPGSIMIHRSNDDMKVVCTKDGYEPARAAVVSEIKGSMFGNVVFGGGVGMIMDHANGSAYEYPPLLHPVMGLTVRIHPLHNKGEPEAFESEEALLKAFPMSDPTSAAGAIVPASLPLPPPQQQPDTSGGIARPPVPSSTGNSFIDNRVPVVRATPPSADGIARPPAPSSNKNAWESNEVRTPPAVIDDSTPGIVRAPGSKSTPLK
jgi:hypothetical protein